MLLEKKPFGEAQPLTCVTCDNIQRCMIHMLELIRAAAMIDACESHVNIFGLVPVQVVEVGYYYYYLLLLR